MISKSTKIQLTSQDILAERLTRLKDLFPEVYSEGKIDFVKLRQALGDEIDTGPERYGLTWAGKSEAIKNIQIPSVGTLLPVPEQSFNFEDTENIIIEGDNLEVLKLLQKSYSGKIKMIYIDPPYNTGNEFIYPDNFREGLEDYLKYSGQVDGDGIKLSTNTETDGRFHSKWLNMMYPRLFLARNLLRNDGVIFVSIDDHEAHTLKLLMNEIFGEENFVGQIVVQLNPRGRHLDRFIAKTHEYILVFARDIMKQAMFELAKDERMAKEYRKEDEVGKYREIELRNRNPAFNKNTRPRLFYPIYVNPQDGTVSLELDDQHYVEVYPKNSTGGDSCWTWGVEKVSKNYHLLLGRSTADGGWRIFRKDYFMKNGKTATTMPKSIWVDSDINNDHGKKAIQELFGSNVFDFPKAPSFIKKMMLIGTTDEDIVLDFFAGSGVTAHAVLDLNAQDNGNRKFILVQLPEPTGKSDYPTIADITKERVRRVIHKLNQQDQQKLNFEGNNNQDRGFKVFKLSSSNFKIWAVVDVFEGQPKTGGQFEVDLTGSTGGLYTELGVGNGLVLNEDTILNNVQRIQEHNGINSTDQLAGMNFSVEMETGTGKTYVYLRTIHELHNDYGFNKFIIVVPSVAIREGVLKNLSITKEHFQTIYGKRPFDYWVYDSKRVSSLRQFATSNQLQILVINIDAFNKKANNIIHKENDRLSGRRPIEFIQATNPIVIIDEPQNMESQQAHGAIASLNPMCTLRYSATHCNQYNLLYRLDPVKAYDLKLVKRIEVDSVLEDGDYNKPYIGVKSIKATKTKISAKITIDAKKDGKVKRKDFTISKNYTDLYKLSGERDVYDGYVVDYIDAGNGCIAFTNGIVVYTGQTVGGYNDDVMKIQILKTVQEHLDKEVRIQNILPQGKRLKVLSLFFIDKVANYAEKEGKIRRWFEEAYQQLAAKPAYSVLNLPLVDEVHNGYFAQDKGKFKDSSGNTKADDEAYQLIMRDKERLLSLEEPLRFIFSHSALREGWDNPNVFQICTLNETKSEIKKRQEIGRGMRLPMDETGYRIFDIGINRLTVVANESYHEFAQQLQTEIEQECGVKFEGRIFNKRDRRKANLKKGWNHNQHFLDLWERIKHKTRYSVEYQTSEIVSQAAKAVKDMLGVEKQKITSQKMGLDITKAGVTQRMLAVREMDVDYVSANIPDLISYIQRETELTRSTIAEILKASGRLKDVQINPQQFLEQAAGAIKATLNKIMVEGIKYRRIPGAEYEMVNFEDPKNEIRGYINRMLEVNKSIYDAIEFDSDVEEKFAKDLDDREDIKLFLKLPRWFKVETPVGTYNPDWAIVKHPQGEDEKLYLVSETKSSTDKSKLRESEWDKLVCGKAHFEVIPEVIFKHVKSASEI